MSINIEDNKESTDDVSLTPSSHSKNLVARVLISPITLFKKKFKAGSIPGSIFTLITATLGSGTITLPYLAAENGIGIAVCLIVFGAILSYVGGMLLVACAEKVGSDKYEEFAKHGYGKKMAILTGWGNCVTMLGFVVSYIVFVKTLCPRICEILSGDEDKVPTILGDGKYTGQLFWAVIYTFFVLFPLSLPRKIGVLRFSSMFGVFGSFYLMFGLVFSFFLDRDLVPSMKKSFENAEYAKITYDGLVYSIPFVVFAFMYQPNIPIVYRELTNRSYKRMNKVIVTGSISVVILYIFAASFGYLGLVGDDENLDTLIDKQNVLEVDYSSWAMKLAVMLLVFAIFAAAPLCVLPAKDTFEELVYKTNGMSKKQNVIVTFVMGIACFILAIAIPGIGDAITILGGTTNPLIGFIFPIIFYLKIHPETPLYKKVLGVIILVFIIAVSIIGLVQFGIDKS